MTRERPDWVTSGLRTVTMLHFSISPSTVLNDFPPSLKVPLFIIPSNFYILY